MSYPNKIEYLFKFNKENVLLPFWEVRSMIKLLNEMHISYEIEKILTYDDCTITKEFKNSLPFDLKIKDVISIYGASGKTSTLYSLAKLCKDHKVLLSTTTKMFYPKKDQIDKEVYTGLPQADQGITFYASRCDDVKCQSPPLISFSKAIKEFDFTFIESDGTKRRPMKYYNQDEPIHIPCMNKGILVLSIDCLDDKINANTIHRLDSFCKHYNVKINDPITEELIAKYLSDSSGVLKETNFPVYLFFNKIESYRQYQMMLAVLSKIDDQVKNKLKIYFGSAHLSAYEYLGGLKR
ncbi:MAG: selenium cofactor biosynthesis protein YqeC [Anaerorhabdus sp.]